MQRPEPFDLRLHLLDRQVIDREGRLVCKVDDLELDFDAHGRPYVVAILVGPLALGPRIGGRIGRWMCAVARRLGDAAGQQPRRIDMRHVRDFGSAVALSCSTTDLDVEPLERWVGRYVVDRIPGSRRGARGPQRNGHAGE